MNNIYIYEFGILEGQVQWALWGDLILFSFISVLMGTFIGCNSSRNYSKLVFSIKHTKVRTNCQIGSFYGCDYGDLEQILVNSYATDYSPILFGFFR